MFGRIFSVCLVITSIITLIIIGVGYHQHPEDSSFVEGSVFWQAPLFMLLSALVLTIVVWLVVITEGTIVWLTLLIGGGIWYYQTHGGSRSTGCLSGDCLHGYGTYREKDSRGNTWVYEGTFQNGKYYGSGKLTHEDRDLYYHGSFVNGLKDGPGTLMENGKIRQRGYWSSGQYIGTSRAAASSSSRASSRVSQQPIPQRRLCSSCGGTGLCEYCGRIGQIDCIQCNGDGQVWERHIFDGPNRYVSCDECGGDGRVGCLFCSGRGTCNDCSGSGYD